VISRERIDIEEYIQYLNILNLIDYDLNEILRNNCLKKRKPGGFPGLVSLSVFSHLKDSSASGRLTRQAILMKFKAEWLTKY